MNLTVEGCPEKFQQEENIYGRKTREQYCSSEPVEFLSPDLLGGTREDSIFSKFCKGSEMARQNITWVVGIEDRLDAALSTKGYLQFNSTSHEILREQLKDIKIELSWEPSIYWALDGDIEGWYGGCDYTCDQAFKEIVSGCSRFNNNTNLGKHKCPCCVLMLK